MRKFQPVVLFLFSFTYLGTTSCLIDLFVNMASNVMDLLFVALAEDVLEPEEYLLLSDLNTNNNIDVPYKEYNKFYLESYTDDECNAYFRFMKDDIYRLKMALKIDDEIKCANGLKIQGIEMLCILLKRFAYPCRYIDMVPMFARPIPQICMITNMIMR
ncbi:uncharacterized protein LOC117107124 [Anneissia japonica]|uniref:uncharacterized protein LOC117107124 n=1 Tax=Anneissia japonica TaxID=1529436 RepID=UPI0014258B5D|nr:uncharacterized protein LOC117107124 [Anneissia japonica]